MFRKKVCPFFPIPHLFFYLFYFLFKPHLNEMNETMKQIFRKEFATVLWCSDKPHRPWWEHWLRKCFEVSFERTGSNSVFCHLIWRTCHLNLNFNYDIVKSSEIKHQKQIIKTSKHKYHSHWIVISLWIETKLLFFFISFFILVSMDSISSGSFNLLMNMTL